MPELFSGPWELRYTVTDTERSNRLVINGSDAADGPHSKAIGRDLVIPVTGKLWSVDVQSLNPDSGEWEAPTLRRIMRFDPTDGIVVRLRTSRPIKIWGNPASNVIDCVYRDPDANPPPTPDPFDFTYGRPG
jgi:hypothetical protein